MTADLRDELVAIGRSAGLAEVGVCDAGPFDDVRRTLEERRDAGLHGGMAFTYRNPARSTDPDRALPGARSLVVGALRYDSAMPEPPVAPAARVARYATTDHYATLRSALGEIAERLRRDGHRAMVVADDNALVDRAVAVRAGIGWAGKSSNVLLPGRGSWFVLGSVITDAAIERTGPMVEDGCGTCRRCMDGCPTGAIVQPGVVDARRCLAWLVQRDGEFPHELRAALGDRIYGCDECQEVCPPTRRADSEPIDVPTVPVTLTAPGPPGSGTWIDLEWLLTAADDELMAGIGRWYVPRREPRFVRRNALVVLGNRHSSTATTAWVRPVLGRYLDGPDDLLAGHAACAALRLGLGDLVEVPTRACRDAVAEELARHGAAPPHA